MVAAPSYSLSWCACNGHYPSSNLKIKRENNLRCTEKRTQVIQLILFLRRVHRWYSPDTAPAFSSRSCFVFISHVIPETALLNSLFSLCCIVENISSNPHQEIRIARLMGKYIEAKGHGIIWSSWLQGIQLDILVRKTYGNHRSWESWSVGIMMHIWPWLNIVILLILVILQMALTKSSLILDDKLVDIT